MSILDDLASAPKPSRAGACRVCEILASLPEEERAAVSAAIGTLSADTIADILTRNGSPVGPTTIKNHRRKGHSS